jgi:hypothetical protein
MVETHNCLARDLIGMRLSGFRLNEMHSLHSPDQTQNLGHRETTTSRRDIAQMDVDVDARELRPRALLGGIQNG